MIRSFLVLLASAVAWMAILWFVLQVDFTEWPIWSLIEVHIAPPLLIWGAWRLLMGYRVKQRARQAREDEAKSKAAREEQMAAARRLHEQELASRHFHCECRWVGLRIKAAQPGDFPEIDLPNARIEIQPAEPDAEDDEFGVLAYSEQDHAIGGFAPQLYELLLQLYDDCPAASLLPVYVVPPAQLALDEVLAGLHRVHGEITTAMEPRPILADGGPVIRCLPNGDSAANAVLSVFEADPELPGLVVLACDSPLAFKALAVPDGAAGVPAQGMVALLLTTPNLSAALAPRSRGAQADPLDAMTPYWEKGLAGAVPLKYLSSASPAACRVLMELPVLAQIRRAAGRPAVESSLDGRHALPIQLERAEVNAGLTPLPFLSEAESAAGEVGDEDEQPPPTCGWLVHNAGGVGQAGARLAQLATALSHRGIHLELLDQGTNTATVVGDTGTANGVALLALASLRCATLEQPVLCAEFAGSNAAAISFAVPAARSLDLALVEAAALEPVAQ